jgi:uncharacterized protein DUF6390
MIVERPIPPPAPRIEPVSGALAFARFAAPPNVLGYCGGSDSDALLGHLQVGLDGPDLVALCRAFDGAWPYLELIARSAGLADPLHARVVEAYWLGNRLLDGVPASAFAADLEQRFRARTPRGEWPRLARKAADGARPHHSFHVLEVMPRIGMLRAGQVQAIVPAMEQCLVRPATVVSSDTPTSSGERHLVVTVQPLMMRDGKLALGPANEESIRCRADVELEPGARVATHWGWSCGQVTPSQARNLEWVTADALRQANETL